VSHGLRLSPPRQEGSDNIGLISDALLLNPWDREILKDGSFQFHPEYVGALTHQGVEPDASLLIRAPPIELAKK
jgi:hypothetical protein